MVYIFFCRHLWSWTSRRKISLNLGSGHSILPSSSTAKPTKFLLRELPGFKNSQKFVLLERLQERRARLPGRKLLPHVFLPKILLLQVVLRSLCLWSMLITFQLAFLLDLTNGWIVFLLATDIRKCCKKGEKRGESFFNISSFADERVKEKGLAVSFISYAGLHFRIILPFCCSERLTKMQLQDPAYRLKTAKRLNMMLVHRVAYLRNVLRKRMKQPKKIDVTVFNPGMKGARGPTGPKGFPGR